MPVASVSDLKAHLSAWLEKVASGDEVVITDRGTPVAKLIPVPPAEAVAERTQALIRAGVLRGGAGKLSADFWDLPRPTLPGNLAVEAVRRERAESW
jgi:prevent-host-death family protein